MLNPYKALRALLPDAPLLAGTVTAYSSGVATVTLPGGGTVNARGEATVGQRVFVRDGAIDGPAPELVQLVIEV